MAIERTVELTADIVEVSELYRLATLAYHDGRAWGESPERMIRLRMRMDLAFLLWRNINSVR